MEIADVPRVPVQPSRAQLITRTKAHMSELQRQSTKVCSAEENMNHQTGTSNEVQTAATGESNSLQNGQSSGTNDEDNEHAASQSDPALFVASSSHRNRSTEAIIEQSHTMTLPIGLVAKTSEDNIVVDNSQDQETDLTSTGVQTRASKRRAFDELEGGRAKRKLCSSRTNIKKMRTCSKYLPESPF